MVVMCLYSISNSTNSAMIDKIIQFYIHQKILEFSFLVIYLLKYLIILIHLNSQRRAWRSV